jgi:hypothetical protein
MTGRKRAASRVRSRAKGNARLVQRIAVTVADVKKIRTLSEKRPPRHHEFRNLSMP